MSLWSQPVSRWFAPILVGAGTAANLVLLGLDVRRCPRLAACTAMIFVLGAAWALRSRPKHDAPSS